MQVRVITMRYSEGVQGFPEDALRKATFGREVLGCEQHFFVYGNVPHIALVLTLGDAPGSAGGPPAEGEPWRRRDPNAPNPEDELPEEMRPAYRALKQWRNDTAKAEGRPAYAIARNTQLAALVKAAPKTLAALKEIEGFGEAFCERYGKKVLEMIAELPDDGGASPPGEPQVSAPPLGHVGSPGTARPTTEAAP